MIHNPHQSSSSMNLSEKILKEHLWAEKTRRKGEEYFLNTHLFLSREKLRFALSFYPYRLYMDLECLCSSYELYFRLIEILLFLWFNFFVLNIENIPQGWETLLEFLEHDVLCSRVIL